MGGGEELTRKIFRSILTVGVAVLACSLLLVMGCFYSFYEGMQEHQLGDELRIAAAAVETNGSTYLEKIKSDRFRVTWIASDGTVLYDTQADAAQMENHLEREEVREALETGTGSSSRYSATLLQKTVYSASRLTDGTVLRLSASRATMGALLLGAFQPILLVVIVLLVLSSLLASRLAKRIVEPLNALDLEHPLENDAYEELSPLLRRIDRQRRQIDAQLAELRQKTDEFTQITAGMNEGLVLLDEKGAVLNINPAAQTLFGVTGACVGQDFLTVDREHSMSLALRTAMTDGHSECPRRARRARVPVRPQPYRVRRQGDRRGAAGLRHDRAGLRRAQPPRVHGERLARAENAAPGHHRQRRAAGERHGQAGGYAPLRRSHPRRGAASRDAHRRHHPPLRAGRGRRAADRNGRPSPARAGGRRKSPRCGRGEKREHHRLGRERPGHRRAAAPR